MRNNFIILVLNLICVLIVLQIQFEFIFINLFDFTPDTNKKINQLLFIFSTGFILSSIFHLIVNVLPNHRRKKTTESIIDNKIRRIGSDMNFLLAYIMESNQIKLKDVASVTNMSLDFLFDRTVTFKHTSFTNNGLPLSIDYTPTKEKELLKTFRSRIIENCDYILNLPFIDTIDFSLINLISSIRDSGYFYDIEVMAREENFVIPRYAEDFKTFFKYYRRLEKKKNFSKNEIKNIIEKE
ncbi:hypothetical protein [Marinifilum fragile]|uniref:hypothetical protein n=1 Tax=Marinifilum fragile TaxID=570161 RepID=UPI002AA951E4|nr:hypothetical protein [Marinifilum fragile]